jgi:hypothetical protein
MRLVPLLLALFVLAIPPAEAKHLTYPPFDEAAQDPSFTSYRDRLIAAVERRDAEAVALMASPDIKLSFGGDAGRAQLIQDLKDEADGEWRWQTLERVLKEGGAFRDNLFIAPWSFLYEPPETLDIYSVALVGGTNVRLRAAPSTEASVIRALTYEVVEMPPYDATREDVMTDASGREWRRMRTTHGEEGWIASSYLRFLLDFRAGFEKTAKGWQMVFFLAGD